MNLNIEKPEVVERAGEKKKGLFWGLEILVFIAVFFVCIIGEYVVLFPGNLIMLMANPEYRAAVAAIDSVKITELTLELQNSDAFIILSLFANIAIIVVVCLFCWLLQKRKPGTLGFTKKHAVKEYLIGLLAGFVVFSVAVGIGLLTGSLEFDGVSSSFAPGVIFLFALGYLIQGMAEEVLCRGYFMVSVARRYPMIAAVLINSLAFAALHLGNSGVTPLAFLNLTLYGIFASFYFIKKGNIWGIGAFHSVWNFVQGNFYGIQVSGMGKTASIFDITLVPEKEFLNGGSFGLEGGLAVTVVLIAGILFFAFWQKKSPCKMPE